METMTQVDYRGVVSMVGDGSPTIGRMKALGIDPSKPNISHATVWRSSDGRREMIYLRFPGDDVRYLTGDNARFEYRKSGHHVRLFPKTEAAPLAGTTFLLPRALTTMGYGIGPPAVWLRSTQCGDTPACREVTVSLDPGNDVGYKDLEKLGELRGPRSTFPEGQQMADFRFEGNRMGWPERITYRERAGNGLKIDASWSLTSVKPKSSVDYSPEAYAQPGSWTEVSRGGILRGIPIALNHPDPFALFDREELVTARTQGIGTDARSDRVGQIAGGVVIVGLIVATLGWFMRRKGLGT